MTNELLTTLLKLQELDFSDTTSADGDAQKAALRSAVPSQILAHYDRLVARGKKGIALVRNQVCTGCHMRLPIGTVNTLMQGQDIQLCDSCGRYLSLAPVEAQPAEAAATPKADKPTPKPRKRKALAHAA